jgi:hypothetical protein
MSAPGTTPTQPQTPPSSDYNTTQANGSFWSTIESEIKQPPVLVALGFGALALILFIGIQPPKSKRSSGARRSTRSITIKD